MRTLKKVLALSLVFAMAFTMMAGAAFKDQDKINTALNDDIQLLTAIGVFKGDESGNFNPEANVKRSEAAKMIYVLKNNGVDDGATSFAGASKFSDVPNGHWADGYVNYAYNTGIMNGWTENGKLMFDPNGNVTGVELAKMLLCTIGYKSDIQGYTGAGWQNNVITDATDAGIFVEYTPSAYAAAPRQWTAKLMVNAINAPYVTYSKGELVVSGNGSALISYGEKFLKLRSVTGKLTSTKTMQLATTVGGVVKGTSSDNEATIAAVPGMSNTENGSFDYAVSNDYLGEIVKVYYRMKNDTEKTLSDATKIYSVLPTKSKVYNTTLGAVTVDGTKVSFDGYSAKDHSGRTFDVYENSVLKNYNYANAAGGARGTISVKVDITESGLGTNNNAPVKLVDLNNDGYIDAIYVQKSTYAIVKSVDVDKTKLTLGHATSGSYYLNTDGTVKDISVAGNLTLNSTNKDNWKYVNLVDTVAEDDVVAITPNYATGEVKFDITKAPVVTGTATSFKVGDAYTKDGGITNYSHYSSVTVGGNELKVSVLDNDGKKPNDNTTTSQDTLMKGYKASTEDSVELKDADTFYTDGKYVIYATGKAATSFTSNYAYLIDVEVAGTWSDGRVKMITSEGTQGTYRYMSDSNLPSSALKSSALNAGTVYEYVLNSDNTVALKALKSAGKTQTGSLTAPAVLTYDKDNKQLNIGSVKALSTSDAKYFVKYTTSAGELKYKVVKGSELDYNVAASGSNINVDGRQYAYSTSTGMPVVVFGVLNFNDQDIPSVTDSNTYAVITGTASIKGDIDNNYYEVVIPVAAPGITELSFKIDKASAITEMAALNGFRNKLVKYEMNSGYAKTTLSVQQDATQDANKWSLVSVRDSTTSNVYGLDKVGASVFYAINGDTKVVYVTKNSSGNLSAVEEGKIVKAAEDTFFNAIILNKVSSGTNTASIIVVEVDGNNIDSAVTAR